MPGRLVVVDNYDSFTFNLVHLLSDVAREHGGVTVDVVRNDALSVTQLLASRPTGVLISPGPGLPEQAGVTTDLVREAPDALPILGVCLGMQAIVCALGGTLARAPRTMHGRTSLVQHAGVGCFEGLPSPLRAMRYHSWIVEPARLPAELEITAWAEDDGAPMALRHRRRPIEAVQFHPESFLSEHGRALVRRFVVACVAGPREMARPGRLS